MYSLHDLDMLRILWMILHEVPQYIQPLDIIWPKWIVMPLISSTEDNLMTSITSTPHLTCPACHPVHVCGILSAGLVTVHGGHHLLQMTLLVVVVESITVLCRIIRSWSKIIRSIRTHGYNTILQAMEVNNTYRRFRNRIETSFRRTCYCTN